MAKGDQVLRFGVGVAEGPRSSTWRLWVPRGKADVYLSRRSLGRDVKVSLHNPGPWRFALTSEHLERREAIQMPDDNPRGAHEWERPTDQAGMGESTQAFSILVPWTEVIPRPAETGEVVWADAPREGGAIQFDVIFVPPTMRVTNHPGSRSMGSHLVGEVPLANEERVFVVWWTAEMNEASLASRERLRSIKVTHNDTGERVGGLSALSFGIENGVGVFLDVALRD